MRLIWHLEPGAARSDTGPPNSRPWRRRLTTLVRRGSIGLAVALATIAASVTGAWYAFPLPEDILHPGPGGGLVLDADGGTLLSIVAVDDQRRLPIALNDAGPWIPDGVVAVEDASFWSHLGIDPAAILGAVRDNLVAGRVVRGASTITMQVAGLKLGHPRTFSGKSVEAFRALQIEGVHDKDDILEAWLNLAPFGGNFVGVEAASRGFFGKSARECSLAEAALLVGLPNSPERFRPDRHPEAAMRRRHVVLDRMLTAGLIDQAAYAIAVESPVIVRRLDYATNIRHAGWMAIDAGGHGRVLETTIDPERQSIVESIVARHADRLPEACDIAVVLVDTARAEVAALVGSSDPLDPRDGAVNGATSFRSPGSALKPFVYATAFEEHRLAPDSIIDDAPADFDGWRPRNIDREHLGRVTAAEALSASRNLPAILITRDLGPSKVAATLRRCGIPLPVGVVDRAGLSLVVGGIEVRPLDLAAAYATIARGGMHRPLHLLQEPSSAADDGYRVLSESTCAAIESCLAGPESDVSAALPFLAFKTGTSSGHRDALAAGWNRRWTVVVWVGRFDGGRDAELLGATAALPILEEILMHPDLATIRSPRPWTAWSVDEERIVGRVGEPRVPEIASPLDGTTLLADGPTLRFRPEIRRGPKARLYLDGAPISFGPIDLAPGRHELRVVEPGREPDSVSFDVVRDDVLRTTRAGLQASGSGSGGGITE